MMKTLGLIILIATSVSAFSESLNAIPKEFWGRYGESPEECNAQFSVGTFKISENLLLFWESSGTPKSITYKNGEMELELDMQGEGEKWVEKETYKLDSTKQTLTMVAEHGTIKFIRCKQHE